MHLPQQSLAILKERARSNGHDVGRYVEMIFHYALLERRLPKASTVPGGEEAIYFAVEIAANVKQRVADWGAQRQHSVAGFSGQIVASFLEQFERDPRDFAMIHHLTTLLAQKPQLTDSDVREGIRRCERIAELPAPYRSRWLFSRLRPLAPKLERDGAAVPLTLQIVEQLVGDAL